MTGSQVKGFIAAYKTGARIQNSPKSLANTRILFAGKVIPAELGRPSHAGPSAVMPPGFPCPLGLKKLS